MRYRPWPHALFQPHHVQREAAIERPHGATQLGGELQHRIEATLLPETGFRLVLVGQIGGQRGDRYDAQYEKAHEDCVLDDQYRQNCGMVIIRNQVEKPEQIGP